MIFLSAIPFQRHALAWACGTLCLPATAQVTQAVTDVVDSTPVMVITASRQGTALKSTPAAISVLGTAHIAQKRATFVGQLLDQVAGVHVTDLGNEQHNMSIRQPLSYGALYQYLEDGVSIRPVGLFNHNALYEMNLAGIAGIEVLRGPASSVYGSNAVAGTVNFLTRTPSDTPTAEVGLLSNTEGFNRLDVAASNTFDTTLGQQGLRLSAYASQRGDSWQQHAEGEKQGITLRHDWTVSPATTLKNLLTYNHLDTDMIGTATPSQYVSNARGRSNQTFTDRQVTATRLSSQLSHRWDSGSTSQATLYYRDNQTDQNPSYLIFNTSPTTASGRTTQVGFASYGTDVQHSSQWQTAWGQVKWLAGVSIDHTPMTGREVNLAIQRDSTGRYVSYTTGSVRRDYAVDINSQAVYSQLEWAPRPHLHWVAGARADWVGYDYSNHLTPSNSTGAPSGSKNYQHVSPKLGAIWNITPQLDGYVSAAQGFVPPEVSSQYGGSLVAPNLTDAIFNNVETGFRYQSDDRRVQAELSVYRLTGKNEQLSYATQVGKSEPRNAGRTRHQGVELGGRWLIPAAYQQSLRVSAALAQHTYQDYPVASTLNYAGKTMQSAPDVLANLEYQIKPMQGLTLSAEASHVGPYWMDNANTVRYQGHTLLHLRANYRVQAYELYSQILNATDQRYADIAASTYNGVGSRNADSQDTYTVGAPRTYVLGLRYHFGE